MTAREPTDARWDRTLLIRGGHLLDPGAGIAGARDIRVDAGRVSAIGPPGTLEHPAPGRAVDASGHVVAPGFIDLHTHVDRHATRLGVDADSIGVRQGVTTVVDAGSTGADTHAAFHRDVVEPAATRVLTWLNLASEGLSRGVTELARPTAPDTERIRALLDRHPGIRGIKVRMSRSVVGATGTAALEQARELADALDVPVMVHVGQSPPGLSQVLGHLAAGDVVTHALHGKGDGLLDPEGLPIAEALDARERGVAFDVGHGSASFAFDVARRAFDAGFRTDTVSTDLHAESTEEPVGSLARTMSKLLAVGYRLEDVVGAATHNAAALLRRPDLGTLRPGGPADLTLFTVVDEPATLTDSTGVRERVGRLLRVTGVVREGAYSDVPLF